VVLLPPSDRHGITELSNAQAGQLGNGQMPNASEAEVIASIRGNTGLIFVSDEATDMYIILLCCAVAPAAFLVAGTDWTWTAISLSRSVLVAVQFV
jgi:hypothetical protein